MAADEYVATQAPATASNPCPAGPQLVVCVDGIYLGQRVEQFEQQPAKLVEKYAYVYQSQHVNPETGKPFELQREFSITLGPKANLRKHLAAHAGRQLTDDEARAFPLHKLVGISAIGTVEQTTNATSGRTYANLVNVMPLMPGMAPLAPRDYTRAEYFGTRKAEYQAGAEKFRAQQAAAAHAAAPIAVAPPVAPAAPVHNVTQPSTGLPAAATSGGAYPFGAGGAPNATAAAIAVESAGGAAVARDDGLPF